MFKKPPTRNRVSLLDRLIIKEIGGKRYGPQRIRIIPRKQRRQQPWWFQQGKQRDAQCNLRRLW